MVATTPDTVTDGLRAGNDYRIANEGGETSSLVHLLGVRFGGTNDAQSVIAQSRNGSTLGLVGQIFELDAREFAERVIAGSDLPHEEMPSSACRCAPVEMVPGYPQLCDHCDAEMKATT
jgi:hypothetical protein